MEITVSSPGSPGTSFTENVKAQIILISDELDKNPDFESLSALKSHLNGCGLNPNYVRNILPFLQFCGLVKYENVSPFINKDFFTNIGHAYISVLKCLQVAKNEPDNDDKEFVIQALERIQETIYFQSLSLMMQNTDCGYARDFYDVLYFAKRYGTIDSTEYLLIQYAREHGSGDYIEEIAETVQQYRNGEIVIDVKTKTKNDDQGKAKSVNSFPYVSGNFSKAGIMAKSDDGRFYLKNERIGEIDNALREVGLLWQNSVK